MLEHPFVDIPIMSPGCDHSFSNQLLKVNWEHIQVTQNPDTHTMLLQIFSRQGDREKALREAEKTNQPEKEQEK